MCKSTFRTSAILFITRQKSSRRNEALAKPAELRAAEHASKAACSKGERKQLRRTEGRLRRKWKAKVALLDTAPRKCDLTKLECDGVLTEDRESWAKQLRQYCEHKYYDEHENSTVQRERLLKLRSNQRCEELDGLPSPALDVGVALQARANMATGNSNRQQQRWWRCLCCCLLLLCIR